MESSRYEIRVQGEISEAMAAALSSLESSVEHGRTTTVLRGELRDQAELHGVLQMLENLGIELIEVRQVPTTPPSRDSGPPR